MTCCVYGCTSKGWINTDLSYHHFPKSGKIVKVESKLGLIETKDRRLTWKEKLKMCRKASDYIRVCSLHFQETDYFIGDKILIKSFTKKRFPTMENQSKICLEDKVLMT